MEWTNQFLMLVLFLEKAVEREELLYLKIHEVEWLYSSMLLSALPFLNLAIFSRVEAKRTGLQLQKQSSSFVDACRVGGRKYQGPRGHLGQEPLNLTTSGGRQKLFAVLLIIEITMCAGKQ